MYQLKTYRSRLGIAGAAVLCISASLLPQAAVAGDVRHDAPITSLDSEPPSGDDTGDSGEAVIATIDAAYVGTDEIGTTPQVSTSDDFGISDISPTSMESGTSSMQSDADVEDDERRIIRCTWSYDYPHPATSSGRKTINAHIKGECTAPVSALYVASRMCTANRDRCGDRSAKANGSRAYITVGGDLACGPLYRNYQATGTWEVTWPPGYTPVSGGGSTHSGSGNSPVKGPWKQNANDVCVGE